MDAAESQTMSATGELKTQAQNLGFDLVGICDAQPAPHFNEYLDWLDKGRHGSMDYLQRHAPLKAHPEKLLPGAQSVIAVGLNYHQPNPPRPGHPRIASYALGRDYHKVIRGKLLSLSAWISQSHPESACRVCVDSAPILERDFSQLARLGGFGKKTF